MIQQYQVSNWADLATRRVLGEIDDLYRCFDQVESSQWIEQALQLLRWASSVRRGMTIAEIYILAIIQDKWEELPADFRHHYHDDFAVFVFKELGRRPKTWQSDLRAVRLFLIEGKGPSLSIEVPVRDQYGNAIYEGGRVRTEVKQWSPLEYPLGKLKALVPFVASDMPIPQHVWGMVADPGVTAQDVREALVGASCEMGNSTTRLSGLRFSLQGPLIVAERSGEEVVVAELNYADYENCALAQDAIKYIMMALGIEDDADIILHITHRAEVFRLYDGGEGDG